MKLKKTQREIYLRSLLIKEGYTILEVAELSGVKNYQTVQYFLKSTRQGLPKKNTEIWKVFMFFLNLERNKSK